MEVKRLSETKFRAPIGDFLRLVENAQRVQVWCEFPAIGTIRGYKQSFFNVLKGDLEFILKSCEKADYVDFDIYADEFTNTDKLPTLTNVRGHCICFHGIGYDLPIEVNEVPKLSGHHDDSNI